MVGAGHVVAERRAAWSSHEQAARPAHARGQRLGAGAHELKVLGRDLLGEDQRGVEVGRVHQQAVDVGQVRGQGVQAGVRRGDREQQRLGAVLGLGAQVERDQPGVGFHVQHDQ